VDKFEMFENFGALEDGVLLPTCNVDEQLAKMSAEEARRAKRKWRKLMRKAKKHHDNLEGWDDAEQKRAHRYYARMMLREKGKRTLSAS